MTKRHVVIGGGPVTTNAIETIRQFEDEASQITLLSDEPAHSRMALPYWLSGQIPAAQTHTADDDYFQRLGVDARIGQRVVKVDGSNSTVQLTDGSTLEFDNLLIATGSSPLSLPIPGSDLPGVQHLWTLADTQSLLEITETLNNPRVVMIGAGFIGFIMLNAMYKRGWSLSVVEQRDHVLPRMLDSETAELVESWLKLKGVDLHCGQTVAAIHDVGDSTKQVELSDGTRIDADVVIVAAGIRPNTAFLEDSGIQTASGILVDDHLRTSISNIYAGGDVAEGPVLGSGEKAVHAIQPTAVDHGRIIGANMAGHDIAYSGSLLMNILDVCGLQCASFGDWSAESDITRIYNSDDFITRKFVWKGEQLSGAIFVGRANDMGMLTDVGMVKGILQTETCLSGWKTYLQDNPFDIRRPYIATKVAQTLAGTTLLGRPAQARQFQFGETSGSSDENPHHSIYVQTKN